MLLLLLMLTYGPGRTRLDISGRACLRNWVRRRGMWCEAGQNETGYYVMLLWTNEIGLAAKFNIYINNLYTHIWYLSTISLSLSLSFCSECVSMMLLPSGRSNSDVYPLQNANASTTTTTTATSNVGVPKPLLVTRTSSPQLTTLPTSNGNANAYTTALHYASNSVSAPVSASASATFSTSTVAAAAAAAAQETTGNLSETGTQAAATSSTTTAATNAATATTTTSTSEPLNSGGFGIYGPILGPTQALGHGTIAIGNWGEIDRHLESVQEKLKAGWTVHVGKEGRLYYCKWVPSTLRIKDVKRRVYKLVNYSNKSYNLYLPGLVREF